MPEEAQAPAGLTIAINGDQFTMDDLTFRERREVRRLARELDGDPSADLDEVMFDDLVAAFVTVCKRRSSPNFTLEDALDLKPSDLETVDAAPPTKPAAKRTKKTP